MEFFGVKEDHIWRPAVWMRLEQREPLLEVTGGEPASARCVKYVTRPHKIPAYYHQCDDFITSRRQKYISDRKLLLVTNSNWMLILES